MQPTRTRFIVLSGLCGAAALAYLTRNAVGTAESSMRADLGLTREQSGWVLSSFFWPYALCQIPAAALAQRLGARRALPLFAVLWSLSSAAFAAGSLGVMIGARVFMGVAQAGLVPVGLSVMARWFPRTGQGSASGGFSSFMSVGGILAGPLAAWLVITCGWRWMFALYALPGLVWALWFAGWFRNSPAQHPSVNEAGYIFFASWFATYLQEARGVTILNSGWMTSLPLVADVTGCLVGGFLSDAVLRWTGSQRLARQGISAISLMLCAGLIFSAWLVGQPLLAVLVISAGMFCAAVANPCAAATVMSIGGAHVAAVSGTMNMCGNFGAAAFPIVVPWLLHHAGGWNAVLLGFAGLHLVAAVFWVLLKTEGRVFGEVTAEG